MSIGGRFTFGRKRNAHELVQHAAVLGGGVNDMRAQSRRRFLMLVTAVMIAGTLAVGLAWSSRQYHHPTLFDSWQNAYGVFDCTTEEWIEPIDSSNNPNGIRTRSDGVIYIEPLIEQVTGDGARLDVFFDNVGAELNESELTLPDGTTLSEEQAFCRGEEAVLQVHRFDADSPGEPIETLTEGFDDIAFLDDGQSFTIALAPVGATIPQPPSAAMVAPTHQHVVSGVPDADGGT